MKQSPFIEFDEDVQGYMDIAEIYKKYKFNQKMRRNIFIEYAILLILGNFVMQVCYLSLEKPNGWLDTAFLVACFSYNWLSYQYHNLKGEIRCLK